jgi:hypothetical protein
MRCLHRKSVDGQNKIYVGRRARSLTFYGRNQVLKLVLKGTVPQDFLPLVFFFKLFLLGPVDTPRNDFDFFRLFAEISDYFGASPVTTTL